MIHELIVMLGDVDHTLLHAARQHLHTAKRVFFVGNGGSAAIASHMAIDYAKNGGVKALALNDPAALTCLANDYGYEQVFAKQLGYHAQYGDVVVLVSSSGKSPNILKAAEAARFADCKLITLSGFEPTNPLRKLGDINFFVPSHDYGCVEITHLAILHSMVTAK